MAEILDGKKLRDKIFDTLKTKIEKMSLKPTLAVVLVGDNPASQIYVRNKKKTAEKLGYQWETTHIILLQMGTGIIHMNN